MPHPGASRNGATPVGCSSPFPNTAGQVLEAPSGAESDPVGGGRKPSRLQVLRAQGGSPPDGRRAAARPSRPQLAGGAARPASAGRARRSTREATWPRPGDFDPATPTPPGEGNAARGTTRTVSHHDPEPSVRASAERNDGATGRRPHARVRHRVRTGAGHDEDPERLRPGGNPTRPAGRDGAAARAERPERRSQRPRGRRGPRQETRRGFPGHPDDVRSPDVVPATAPHGADPLGELVPVGSKETSAAQPPAEPTMVTGQNGKTPTGLRSGAGDGRSPMYREGRFDLPQPVQPRGGSGPWGPRRRNGRPSRGKAQGSIGRRLGGNAGWSQRTHRRSKALRSGDLGRAQHRREPGTEPGSGHRHGDDVMPLELQRREGTSRGGPDPQADPRPGRRSRLGSPRRRRRSGCGPAGPVDAERLSAREKLRRVLRHRGRLEAAASSPRRDATSAAAPSGARAPGPRGGGRPGRPFGDAQAAAQPKGGLSAHRKRQGSESVPRA